MLSKIAYTDRMVYLRKFRQFFLYEILFCFLRIIKHLIKIILFRFCPLCLSLLTLNCRFFTKRKRPIIILINWFSIDNILKSIELKFLYKITFFLLNFRSYFFISWLKSLILFSEKIIIS